MPKETYGRAFEYAVACALADAINASKQNTAQLSTSTPLIATENAYKVVEAADVAYAAKLMAAGAKASARLIDCEPKLSVKEVSYAQEIIIDVQPDAAGQRGDVRDVVVMKTRLQNGEPWEIGMSCKHNHDAVKHPRVSPTTDFGTEWLGVALMGKDFARLKEIYENVDADTAAGFTKWNEVPDKADRYYMPILELVLEKIHSNPNQAAMAAHLLEYLIGLQDFYKIIYEDRATRGAIVTTQGFNFHGTLNQAAEGAGRPTTIVRRLHAPNRVINAGIVPGRDNTLEVFFDNGWSISMRIHNARTLLEKSLKMDVRLESTPPDLFMQADNI